MNSTCIRTAQDRQVIFKIDVRTTDNTPVGEISVRVSGAPHTGPSSVVVAGGDTDFVRDGGAWDCREWQWWDGYPYGDEKRPRLCPAEGGMEQDEDLIRIRSRYLTDGVATFQEWFLRDHQGEDTLVYDCLQTVKNVSNQSLREYGQFFASYTSVNEEKGHFFWDATGALVNYLSLGATHLDRYITGPEKAFRALGRIPHCPRGDGLVAGVWHRPVSVSHPSPGGYRHIMLCEPRTTAAITMGMSGIAMDYIIYPPTPDQSLAPGAIFTTHIRHVIMRLPDGQETQVVERLWDEFEGSHQGIAAVSRAPS